MCWEGKIGVVCGREHTSLINEPQLPPPKRHGLGLVPRLAEMLHKATHCAGCSLANIRSHQLFWVIREWGLSSHARQSGGWPSLNGI